MRFISVPRGKINLVIDKFFFVSDFLIKFDFSMGRVKSKWFLNFEVFVSEFDKCEKKKKVKFVISL